MDYVLRAVLQIAAFLLFQTVLLHLVERTRYEKYIRLFSGFLLILLLCSVIFSFRGEADLMERVYRQVEYAEEEGEFRMRLEQAEEDRQAEIETAFEERILEEVKLCAADSRFFLVSGSVELNESYEIERVELELSRRQPKEGVSAEEASGRETSVRRETEAHGRVREPEEEQPAAEAKGESAEPIRIEPVVIEPIGSEAAKEESGREGPDEPEETKETAEDDSSGDPEVAELKKELAIRLGISREQIGIRLSEADGQGV